MLTLVASGVLVALLWVAWRLLLDEPAPRWETWLRHRLRTLDGRFRPRPADPDPFEVLRLQTRLSVVAGGVRELETIAAPFAKAQRLGALCAAYDALLEEACELAGVPPVPPESGGAEERRWYVEQQLTERGWSW